MKSTMFAAIAIALISGINVCAAATTENMPTEVLNGEVELVDYIHVYKTNNEYVGLVTLGNFFAEVPMGNLGIGEPPLVDIGEPPLADMGTPSFGTAARMFHISDDQQDEAVCEEALALLQSGRTEVMAAEKFNGAYHRLTLKFDTEEMLTRLVLESTSDHLTFACPDSRITVSVNLEDGKYGILPSAYTCDFIDLDDANVDLENKLKSKSENVITNVVSSKYNGTYRMTIHYQEPHGSTSFVDADLVIQSSNPTVKAGCYLLDFERGLLQVEVN